jgi:hypothetical protein
MDLQVLLWRARACTIKNKQKHKIVNQTFKLTFIKQKSRECVAEATL